MPIKISTPVTLLRRIYRSDTATTYMGVLVSDDNPKKVAVKVFDTSADAQLMAGIEERACNAIRAVHSAPENIVLARHHELKERTIAVSPYINGVTVRELIKKRGSISRMLEEDIESVSISLALSIGIDACQALAVLHEEKYAVNGTVTAMVHSDFGPKNLLVDCTGKTHAIDFGVCLPKTITSREQSDTYCTPGYCSPQQAACEPYDARADQFTLSMSLYELITGMHAFLKASDCDESLIRRKIIHAAHGKMRAYNPAVPKDLEKIVYCSLQKDPEKRYARIQDLEQELCSVKAAWEQKHAPVSLGYAVGMIMSCEELARSVVCKPQKLLAKAGGVLLY